MIKKNTEVKTEKIRFFGFRFYDCETAQEKINKKYN